MFRHLLFPAAVLLAWSAISAAEPPMPATVPPATVIALDDANRALKIQLDRRRQELAALLEKWKVRRDAYNKAYGDREFNEGSPEAIAGASELAQVLRERGEYLAAARQFRADVGALLVDRSRSIDCMNALADELHWETAEKARLNAAMRKLALDGDANATIGTIAVTWRTIAARGQDADLAREAAAGHGPGFPGAGTQSSNDCTIFALANASGVPYPEVAARATKLVAEGAWRGDADRAQPQQVIERQGLNGDEVIMLAEALGQAEVIRGADFAATIAQGRPILACVVVVDEHGDDFLHQVVLSRTFQHSGETWYEMMDSNQGAQERRYLTARELDIMLHENGVAYAPEPGRTPALLRPEGSP